MTRDLILQRIQNGETVTVEDLAALNNTEQLNALKREAAERQQEQDRIRQMEEKRKAFIAELVELDKAAESAARFYDDIERRRAETTRKFDEQELEARGEWLRAYQRFNAKFREVYNQKPNETHLPEVQKAHDELKVKGAKIKDVIFNVSKLPLSPSMMLLVREKEINNSFNNEP